MQGKSYSVFYPNGNARCTRLPLELAERAERAVIAQGFAPRVVMHEEPDFEVRASSDAVGLVSVSVETW
jgi:hypothetical protein